MVIPSISYVLFGWGELEGKEKERNLISLNSIIWTTQGEKRRKKREIPFLNPFNIHEPKTFLLNW